MLVARNDSRIKSHTNGFTLIEVMSSLLILILGVLSILQLQAANISGVQSATNRINAIWLVNDITEKIHNNPAGGVNGFYAYSSSSAPTGPICNLAAPSGCSGQEIANFDLNEWHNMLMGNPPSTRPFLPSAEASITDQGNGSYLIEVSWQDLDRGDMKTFQISEEIVFFNTEQMSTYGSVP